jgi:hypothetical protein
VRVILLQFLRYVLGLGSTLGPSPEEIPDDLILATRMAQICMESMIGGSTSSQVTANSAESTPQKLPPPAFDALVRENKNLIQRVSRPNSAVLAAFSYCYFTGDRFLQLPRKPIQQPDQRPVAGLLGVLGRAALSLDMHIPHAGRMSI